MPTPTRNEFIALVKKYQQQKASPEEIEFIQQYYQYFDREEKISPGLSDKEKELLGNKLFRNIESRIDAPNPLHSIDSTPSKIFSLNFSKGRKIAAAAIVLFLIGTGVFLLRNQSAQKQIAVNQNDSQRFKNDIGPGGDKAVLTLADGTKINLDSVHNGILSQQGYAKVAKFKSGLLTYHLPNINVAEKN